MWLASTYTLPLSKLAAVVAAIAAGDTYAVAARTAGVVEPTVAAVAWRLRHGDLRGQRPVHARAPPTPPKRVVDLDVGRAVIQCACGHAVRWAGTESAHAMGWHGRYVEQAGGATVRVWTCPDCWVPPPAPHVASVTMPPYLRALVLNGPAEIAEAQLELARAEPARFAAYLDEVERLVATMWGGAMRSRRAQRGAGRRGCGGSVASNGTRYAVTRDAVTREKA